jgi:hypothetical protein
MTRQVVIPIALLSSLALIAARTDDSASRLPFAVGERISYDVTVAGNHKVGDAAMWVEGPVNVRGITTYLLRFDSKVRVALMSGNSTSSSWFDPAARLSLRYYKRERSPIGRDEESVEMFPQQKSWRAIDGKSGISPDAAPLDELSFIYFIRTLPMVPGPARRYDRHFDAARDPVMIQVVRPEVIATPMGEIKTMLVEMRVRDPKHFKQEGIIRINVTNDRCRLPVRIESTMPILGKAVLTMKSENASADCAVR